LGSGSWLRRLFFCGEPCGEFVRRDDAEVGVHAVVAEAADLGAEDGVGPGEARGEVDVDGMAGNGVLLEAHFGDGEAVDDVERVEAEVDLAIGGEDKLGGDEVVGAVRVGGVDAYGVAFFGGDELRTGDAEGGVGAGVVEVPGELDSGDFDLERGGRGSGVAGGGPEALGLDGEKGEEEGERGEGEILDAPEIFLRGVAASEKANEEDQVREGEEAESDPETEQKLVVQRGAVRAGIDGEVPEVGVFQRFEGKGHVFRILCLVLGCVIAGSGDMEAKCDLNIDSNLAQHYLRLLFGIITGRIGLLFDPMVTEVPCK